MSNRQAADANMQLADIRARFTTMETELAASKDNTGEAAINSFQQNPSNIESTLTESGVLEEKVAATEQELSAIKNSNFDMKPSQNGGQQSNIFAQQPRRLPPPATHNSGQAS